jgi:hypothetical protein
MTLALNFVLLYGSVRRERQGIKFARFLKTQLEKRGHTSKLIDPVEYDLPLLDKMYKEYSKGALRSGCKPSPILFAKPMDFWSSAASIITAFPRP